MPSYMKPGVAADHAHMLAESHASNTLRGRAVESWREMVSDDGAQLLLRVTFAPPPEEPSATPVTAPSTGSSPRPMPIAATT